MSETGGLAKIPRSICRISFTAAWWPRCRRAPARLSGLCWPHALLRGGHPLQGRDRSEKVINPICQPAQDAMRRPGGRPYRQVTVALRFRAPASCWLGGGRRDKMPLTLVPPESTKVGQRPRSAGLGVAPLVPFNPYVTETEPKNGSRPSPGP